MTAPAVPISQPGIYHDLPAADYHADPIEGGSLSSTGARKLLPPGCPAKFRYWADHPQPPKREFDLGHAAHRTLLGVGEEIVVVDADTWKTKAAREARDEAYDAGQVPLLPHELTKVEEMIEAIWAHPVAAAVFSNGRPEVTLAWRNDIFGVWQRARLDWFPNGPITIPDSGTGKPRPYFVVPDYKTCVSAEPDALSKAMHSHGYHQQIDWYSGILAALGATGDVPLLPLLVAQEKEPPYVVTVAQPDAAAMRVAATRNRKALDVYSICMQSGVWPGYDDDVVPLALPGYAEAQHEAAVEQGLMDIDWQLPIPSTA